MEHHSAQLNGIKQHYVKAGSGPAVMLLHGWPQTCYEWRHVIERLAGNFTVVAPDLRGFGYTSKPTSGYDAATIASDLAALTAHLAFKDITVIGHDWGAVFGYVYAASSPNEVSALGVVEMRRGDGSPPRSRSRISGWGVVFIHWRVAAEPRARAGDFFFMDRGR
jgi:pimeloyl-ACP methyl ester carboxylesterase